MRAILTALLAFGCFASALHSAEPGFVRVWPGWRSADSFDRISEYFSNRENTGHETIIRTHPDIRAGFYFLARTTRDTAATPSARFILDVITPDSATPHTYIFPVAVPAGSHSFLLGLTGADWPDQKVHPVAWKIELRAADDRILAVQKSFLWEKPAK